VFITLFTATITLHARADETQACIDASDKGQILRIDKRLLDARDQFALCARQQCPGAIREACVRWLDEAQRSISAIAFVIKDDVGNDVSPVSVNVDGVIVAERYDGTALVLDPGEHTFRFDAAGKATLEKRFRLTQGERERQERIVFESPARAPAESARSVDTESHASPGALRSAGLVVVGTGLVGIAMGSVFGLRAIAKNDGAHCDANNVCVDPQARRDAQGVARVSTISFVAGGALAAGGLALFLLAPRSSSRPTSKIGLLPELSTHSAGVTVGGAW
jgi:hypothetical protein